MTDTVSRYLRPDVLARITGLELRARLVVEGFVSGQHRSPYRGYSVEFAEHREYVPGDDIRHIDWRVWGRADRLFIKQYEEETNLRTHVIVDCSASMRYPEEVGARKDSRISGGARRDSRTSGAENPPWPPLNKGGKLERLNKFDYACTAAAALAYLLTHQQDAVGLLLFDDAIRTDMPPLSNPAHLRGILAALEAARLERPTDVKAVFAQLAGRLRRRSLVVLISDLLGERDDVIRGLEQLRFARHDVIVLHLLDSDERTFPFQDNILFEALEHSDIQLFTDPQSLREAYLEALDDFVRPVRDACIDHRIDFVEMSTTDPLDVALRRYLAARASVRK